MAKYYYSGNSSGFQYGMRSNNSKEVDGSKNNQKNRKDEDLVIEDNTIYEIDRECYERLKRHKKRK
ncbi:MAG TPA: hypothetical protein GXZ28_02110 [Clostridiales bacterium]|nr:hypothetical protein [Clostridiales bacterium]